MSKKSKALEEFYKLCFRADRQTIFDMNDVTNDHNINNVIVGLSKECFGLRIADNTETITYQLLYINGYKDLKGLFLNMTIDHHQRDKIVFFFAMHLSQEFPHLDFIDTFNTFQQFTRSILEKANYFTISSQEMARFKGKDSIIISPSAKGVMKINFIDKVEFLREFFGNRHEDQVSNENENYIYLMLNKRNGLTKIGTSIQPKYREKTLQGEEPEVFLISIWPAPRKVEKELHKMFFHQKERGEWFNLKSEQMNAIKERMSEFV
ncbi:GIY-YIG nuclease family protein [Roseivirga sp. BDSF3-8]|uniref:GIY-YIG nuclease family protein n=1 Tax=Roseivirga sp. BDSF3-8 TaxID=3241598 RepID=UPI0035322D44